MPYALQVSSSWTTATYFTPFGQTYILLLIQLGGLGFLTLEELYLWQRKRRNQEHFSLSLHSRIVLVTMALRELKLRQQYNVSVIGVKEQETNRMIVPPDPDASRQRYSRGGRPQ